MWFCSALRGHQPTLTTNLPKEIMAFPDVPFVSRDATGENVDNATWDVQSHGRDALVTIAKTSRTSGCEPSPATLRTDGSQATAVGGCAKQGIHGRSFVHATVIDNYLQRFFKDYVQNHRYITTRTSSYVTRVRQSASGTHCGATSSDTAMQWTVEWTEAPSMPKGVCW